MSEEKHHGHEEEGTFDPAPHRPKTRTVAAMGIFGVGIFAGLFALGIFPRMQRRAQTAQAAETASHAEPHVVTVKPTRAKTSGAIDLPGSIQPLQETTIYARTSGYVKRWLVDIGDSVTEGQLLAELETPELDREIEQAQAALVQSQAGVEQQKAQLVLAKKTDERTQGLHAQGLASQQDVDTAVAASAAGEANVHAAQAAVSSAAANLKKLAETKAFARVLAPFAGTITSRNIEVGALVNEGSAGAPLYKVADTSIVRVFLLVPQLYASSIAVGQEVKVTLREDPKHPYTGKVTRTSHELDPSAHTLRTEVQVKNPDGVLLPGSYARANFATALTTPPLIVPATALVVDSKGTRVATVVGGKIAWKTVDVGADLGEALSIVGGLDENADIVTVPNDKLLEGTPVVVEEKK